jgi:hypothetical protein
VKLVPELALEASDSVGVVEDVDGIELWGPVGSGDAFYFPRSNDGPSACSPC